MNTRIDKIFRKISLKKELKNYCFAPDNNIYFRVDGFVTMCCTNFKNILGKYPAQSLSEIINGKTRKELQDVFAKGKVLSGCEYCFDKLCNNNPAAATFQVYKKHYGKSASPVTAEFELSNHCNLKCLMCNEKFSNQHIISSKIEKSIVYDKSFVTELEPYIPFLKRASFKGGEPFLIDLYYDIWESIIKINKNTIISVTSNGTMLNERVRDILSRGKFDVNISIDSLVKENFEMIRQNASFEVFRKNLDYFFNYCKTKRTNFTSCTCIMTNNFQDVPAIFRFANEKKFTMFINYVEHPLHLSLKHADKSVLAEAIRILHEKRPPFGFISNKKNLQIYNAMIKQLENWYKAKPEKIRSKDIQPDSTESNNIQFLIKKLQQNITAYYNIAISEESEIYKHQLDKFITVYKKSSAYIAKEKLIDFFLTSDDSIYFMFFDMTEDQIIDLLKSKFTLQICH